MANDAARSDIAVRVAERMVKKAQVADGYYYHSPEEEHSYALSVVGGKALLEYGWNRDVDYLDSNGVDINSEDTIDVQEAAIGSGTNEVTAEELQNLITQSGIKFDLMADIKKLEAELDEMYGED